jgi:toxin ParE1/3/4
LRYRLAEAADADIEAILRYTAQRFGSIQRRRYAQLIETAAIMIGEAPERVGTRQRDELAPGVRSFHVELAAGRRGAAAHVLYYLLGRLDEDSDGVIILRVLHERMDPVRHFIRDL